MPGVMGRDYRLPIDKGGCRVEPLRIYIGCARANPQGGRIMKKASLACGASGRLAEPSTACCARVQTQFGTAADAVELPNSLNAPGFPGTYWVLPACLEIAHSHGAIPFDNPEKHRWSRIFGATAKMKRFKEEDRRDHGSAYAAKELMLALSEKVVEARRRNSVRRLIQDAYSERGEGKDHGSSTYLSGRLHRRNT